MQPTFKPGEIALCSGIYQVRHAQHRLEHSVTILKDDQFPVCRKCGNLVTFRLERMVSENRAVHGSFRVVLEEYSIWKEKGGGSPPVAA
ncbi:MAG TPA: hypothetical protein VFA71_01045 [Terriglobales bacterium]|nr:hypothetical protein [Terriglobales bacterium]